MEHWIAARIGEVDPLEPDVALDGLGHDLAVDLGHRRVQQIEDPRGRGHGALVQIEGAPQPGQGPQQALSEEDQHRVAAHRERARDHGPATDEQGAGEADHDHHADQRRERAREHDRPPVGAPVVVGEQADAIDLAGLRDERLDGLDPREVVGQLARHLGGLEPHRRVARRDRVLEAEAAPQDERHRQDREQGDQRRGPEEDRPDRHAGRAHLDQIVGAVVEEALELVDVVVEDGEQLARAAIGVPGHAEALDVGVGVQPQLVLHGLSEVAPALLEEELEQALEPPHDHGQHGDHDQLGLGRGDPHRGQPAAVSLDDGVDGEADQQRRREIEQLVEHAEAGREHDLLAVGGGVRQQPRQGGPSHLTSGDEPAP